MVMLRTKGTKNLLSLPAEILPRFARQNDNPAIVSQKKIRGLETGFLTKTRFLQPETLSEHR